MDVTHLLGPVSVQNTKLWYIVGLNMLLYAATTRVSVNGRTATLVTAESHNNLIVGVDCTYFTNTTPNREASCTPDSVAAAAQSISNFFHAIKFVKIFIYWPELRVPGTSFRVSAKR